MKNILVLNYEFPPLGGGASPVSYEISKGYVDLGYNVDVITMGYKDLASFENLDGINIYRVKCWRSQKQVCHPWEQATYLYSGYKKAKEIIKTKKYDICHCHFIIPTGVLALKLKKEFGLEYIITAHGSDTPGYNQNRFTAIHKITPPLLRKVINNSKKVISPSNFLKDLIESYYGKSDKIKVIPNGIEKGKFKPLEKQKYILTVSRLQKGKGIQDLIEAVKDLDLGDWKIKIVGEGPYKETLENMIKNYKLEEKFDFLGWIDNKSDEMKELYGKASIFCQPSYFESFGITLLEAMQAGCTIIARNIGGFSWLSEDTENMLFENINNLKNLINNSINNQKNIGNLIENNSEKVKKYERENIVLKYNDYLK